MNTSKFTNAERLAGYRRCLAICKKLQPSLTKHRHIQRIKKMVLSALLAMNNARKASPEKASVAGLILREFNKVRAAV